MGTAEGKYTQSTDRHAKKRKKRTRHEDTNIMTYIRILYTTFIIIATLRQDYGNILCYDNNMLILDTTHHLSRKTGTIGFIFQNLHRSIN